MLKYVGIPEEFKDYTAQFDIVSAGRHIKATSTCIDNNGSITSENVFYYGPDRYVREVAGLAQTTADRNNAIARDLYDCGIPFLNYSFLSSMPIKDRGIPPLTAHDLSSSPNWDRFTEALNEFIKSGVPEITLKGDDDATFRVSFEKNDKIIYPKALEIKREVDSKTTFMRKISVQEVGVVNGIPVIRKALYSGQNFDQTEQRLYQAFNAEIEITLVKFNEPIEDSLLSFDPASVDLIYDSDTETTIRVPR
jgi:hypothetical protein